MNPENELRVEIEGTTYIVSTHYTEGDETVLDKITRLVKEDEKIVGAGAI